ncbi:MAG: glutamate-5-semialdehyde dehydrogenase, partial [Methyloligellaceae bacterium]
MALEAALDQIDARDLTAEIMTVGAKARRAAHDLATLSRTEKDRALNAMARSLRARTETCLNANGRDIETAKEAGRPAAFIDRLTLTADRVEAMAKGLEDIAALPDPVGAVLAEWERPNGLRIQRVRTPLGVIGMIYESRPNVTADAGGLCLKAGNAVVLRGGSEAQHSNMAILACLKEGLRSAGLPEDAIQIIPTTDRAAVGLMLKGLGGAIDVIVPRGGKSLVQRVQNEARVPIFAHLEGICHVYVDKDAKLEMARDIVVNAKMRRTGICGAAETLLVDRAAASTHLAPLIDALVDSGCTVRGDDHAQAADSRVEAATEEDWSTEYLDSIISVKAVNGVNEAMDHIARYGSQHTDSIVTDNDVVAETFLANVDSAIVLHNASTQFADGGEFGMGAEIGI